MAKVDVEHCREELEDWTGGITSKELFYAALTELEQLRKREVELTEIVDEELDMRGRVTDSLTRLRAAAQALVEWLPPEVHDRVYVERDKLGEALRSLKAELGGEGGEQSTPPVAP